MFRRWFLLLSMHCSSIQTLNIIQKPSSNFNERKDKKTKQLVSKPTHIIMHYTTDCYHKKSFRALSNFIRPVSAHYLIAANGTVYQLVNESKRAWHAGKSSWRDNKQLNTYSIGIEIVNPGFTKHKQDPCTMNTDVWNQHTSVQVPGSSYHWYTFTPEQEQSLIELCKDICKRYNIKPEHVLGHSDIAPGRKVDPGPLFPWQKLARHNIGTWPTIIQKPDRLPPIKDIQIMLKKWGYKVPMHGKLDRKTKSVIKSFHMHFRPDNISSTPDEQTVAILQALLNL